MATGWNRIGTAIDAPGAMINGYVLTPGGTKSIDDDEIAVTVRLQGPLLCNVNGSSRCEPTQQSPNAP